MDYLAAVELCHLIFVRHLAERIPKNLYCIKGGCNLRFFFKSIRYSEDLDLDIQTASTETLRSNVRKIFKSSSFSNTLRSHGIAIKRTSEPKQTETTQRWKITLELSAVEREIPTKIEFSRRERINGEVFEAVDSDVINSHKLYPIFASHYASDNALEQKIAALMNRKVTQARDVFDIHLLLKLGAGVHNASWSTEKIKAAQDCVAGLRFDDFMGQVVAYLLPHYQVVYNDKNLWEQMVAAVIRSLKKVNSW